MSALARPVAAGGLVLLAATACGSADGGTTRSESPSIKATDRTCVSSVSSLAAGTTTLTVTNGGRQVTEVYVYAPGDRIMGEVENVAPGTSRSLTVSLKPGTYQIACKPGMTGKGIRVQLAVTGSAAPRDQALVGVGAAYGRFLAGQATALVATTRPFVRAVLAGDIARAKQLYPAARIHYETMEVAAEQFPALDAVVDVRVNDVEAGQPFVGFHRLEQDLWVRNDISRDKPVATKLMADVTALVGKASSLTYTPEQLAAGAKELLDEIATGKVTGEEERYSHIDLVDFQGNLTGASEVWRLLQPAVAAKDPSLARTTTAAFARLQQTLARYGSGSSFVSYSSLTPAQVKELAAAVDAVAEPMSRVAGVLVAPAPAASG